MYVEMALLRLVFPVFECCVVHPGPYINIILIIYGFMVSGLGDVLILAIDVQKCNIFF